MKRLLTIQDFSCMGRCSLTVALPVVSSCGVECVSLPTAVLSNHTAFPSWTLLDMSDEMPSIAAKWKEYGAEFDCIYTGYLTNDQIPCVMDIVAGFKTDRTILVVDPAMADDGKLYPGFDMGHVEAMRKLASKADLLLPNLTEASLLSGVDIVDEASALKAMESLLESGAKNIVLSSASFDEGTIGIYVASKGKIEHLEFTRLPGKYHGTGDLFASAIAGEIVQGIPLLEAVRTAHEFVASSIEDTLKEGRDGLRYGVNFERSLYILRK